LSRRTLLLLILIVVAGTAVWMRAVRGRYDEIPAFEKIGRGVELSLAEAHNDNGDRAAARRWVSSALDENPFDLHALRWRKFLVDLDGDADEGRRAEDAIAKLANDPQRAANPVVLSFAPQQPTFEPDTTIDVNGTRVFDHRRVGHFRQAVGIHGRHRSRARALRVPHLLAWRGNDGASVPKNAVG
jgi:hypothetical protein